MLLTHDGRIFVDEVDSCLTISTFMMKPNISAKRITDSVDIIRYMTQWTHHYLIGKLASYVVTCSHSDDVSGS